MQLPPAFLAVAIALGTTGVSRGAPVGIHQLLDPLLVGISPSSDPTSQPSSAEGPTTLSTKVTNNEQTNTDVKLTVCYDSLLRVIDCKYKSDNPDPSRKSSQKPKIATPAQTRPKTQHKSQPKLSSQSQAKPKHYHAPPLPNHTPSKSKSQQDDKQHVPIIEKHSSGNQSGGTARGGNGGNSSGGSPNCSTGNSLVGVNLLNIGSCNGGDGADASGGDAIGGLGGGNLLRRHGDSGKEADITGPNAAYHQARKLAEEVDEVGKKYDGELGNSVEDTEHYQYDTDTLRTRESLLEDEGSDEQPYTSYANPVYSRADR